MHKHRLLISMLILTGIIFTGCFRSYIVSKDKFSEDFVLYKMNPNVPLAGKEVKLNLYVSPQAVIKTGEDDEYNLIVMQKTRNEDLILYTMKGKSLIMMIDGERYEFETKERVYGETSYDTSEYPLWRYRNHDKSGIIIEKVSYGATFEIIEKIANGKNVEVKVLGKDDRSVQKRFRIQQFELFTKFVRYANKKL